MSNDNKQNIKILQFLIIFMTIFVGYRAAKASGKFN